VVSRQTVQAAICYTSRCTQSRPSFSAPMRYDCLLNPEFSLRSPLRVLLLAVLVGVFQPGLSRAQTPSDTDTSSISLEEALREHSYPLRTRNGSLHGSGGRWLREQAKAATLITLGEMHGTQEIPAIMGALLEDLQTTGEVDHLALEVSPWTADLMTDSLRALDSTYTTFIERRPASIPFYALQPERDLIRNFVRNSASERPLWGLDQIFAFATELAMDRLAKRAPTAEARRALAATRTAGRSDSTTDPALRHIPSSMPFPLMRYPRTAFDSLGSYFEGVDEAQRILDELATSTEIYRINDTKNYRSNQLRARYLRRNLQREFHRSDAKRDDAPQVVIKVGGRHAYKGLTPNNVLDVGNLAVALAEQSGGTALNVAVFCGPNSTARDFPAGTVDCWQERQAPFAKVLDDEPMLFNLTAIHPLLHEGPLDPPPALERMLWAFDVVVLVPNAQPSSLITPIIDR